MVDLNPAPNSLGFSSPVLGPWFERSDAVTGDLATPLVAPDADLACALTLSNQGRWLAPGGGTLSFFIATATRPHPLSDLRKADATSAFTDGALVALFTLLPEVALRLGTLAHGAPRPDSATAAAAGVATRPVINRLAFEIPAANAASTAALNQILPNLNAADLSQQFGGLPDDTRKAAYLGLASSAGGIANGARAATILRRPEKDDQRLIENRTGADLTGKLWCFDRHGRCFDAGAWAAILTHLATVPWDNLWASSDPARQRTAGVAAARTVHLVNAHEGPLEANIASRITGQLADLNAVGGSGVVYTVATTATPAPAIGLSAAADVATDTAPMARIAPLPAGPYQTLATATPFAGWTGSGTPGPLPRDFLRVALVDIEHQTIGQKRSAGSVQADPRRRITAQSNTASPVFLSTADTVAAAVTGVFLQPGSTVDFIAPELDRYWGAQTAASLPAADPFADTFDTLTPTADTLIGSGSVAGATAADQMVVISFPNSSFPAGAWVRVYPHARDTTTGHRFRMDGTAALVDAQGAARLLVLLPDGKNGDGTSAKVSFDLTMTTASGSRFYTDLRVARPAVTATPAALAITNLGGRTLYCPEQGANVTASGNGLQPGQSLIAVDSSGASPAFSAVDATTIRPEDMVTTALDSVAVAGDRVITRDPAFVQTKPGDYDGNATGGAQNVHESEFFDGAKGQSVLDFAAHDRASNTGVVGALAARSIWHENWPVAQGHPGVNGAPEIHAEGVAVAGLAADALRLLMRERRATNVQDFISFAGEPFTAATAAATPGVFTAFLETGAKGTHGEPITGAYALGRPWSQIKTDLDSALSSEGTTVDALIDSSNFNDDVAASAMDRIHHKAKNGVRDFARAALAAIGRAEDLICLHTPALDSESWDGEGTEANIALLAAITARMGTNPALHCLVVIPEKDLPSRNVKLGQVRKAAIQGAVAALQAADAARVAIATPIAGPGRPHYMASTTLIVDDAAMLTGAAHGWRRGLVFDSALSASLFDERLRDGRPQEIIDSRRTLVGGLLGVGTNFVPDTASDLIIAAKVQNTGGGFGRVKPGVFPAAADISPAADREIWNPSPRQSHDWVAAIAGLTGDQATEFQNGTR